MEPNRVYREVPAKQCVKIYEMIVANRQIGNIRNRMASIEVAQIDSDEKQDVLSRLNEQKDKLLDIVEGRDPEATSRRKAIQGAQKLASMFGLGEKLQN